VVRSSGRPRRRTYLAWVLVLGALATGGIWLWEGLTTADPHFRAMLVTRNGEPIRLLNGETLSLRPQDRIRIQEIDTNIPFNHGVRLFCGGLDASALLYQDMELHALLPGEGTFDRHRFRVEVKRHHVAIGHVLLTVEPTVDDWLARAARIIDPEKRRAILTRALELHSKDERLFERLLEEHVTGEEWSEAAAMLETRADEEPGREAVLRRLLEIYEADENHSGILSTLKRLSDLRPEDVSLRYRLASRLEEMDRLGEAAKEYERILKDLESHQDRAAVLKTLGYLYARQGDREKAIERYQAAADMDPGDVNLYYNLAGLHDQAGRRDQADRYLRMAVTREEGDVAGRLRLAEAAIEKGDPAEAEGYLNEVLAREPDSLEAMLLLVNVLDRQGKKEELKPLYRRILQLDPKNQTLAYNLAVLEYETGEYAESAARLQDVTKADPTDRDALELLFGNLVRLERQDAAGDIARRLLETDPANLEYLLFLIEAYHGQERYSEMIPLLEQGLREHPSHPVLTDYLILAFLKTDRQDRALEIMEGALKTRPNDMDLMTRTAELADRRGKLDLALRTYRRMLEQNPGHKEALKSVVRLLMERGRAQEAAGDLKAALGTYQEIMTLAPGIEEAEEAYLQLRLKAVTGGS